jgi:hypothetical protein
LMGGGKAGGGKHGSAESEGESEDGVLPLNHFERDAEIVKDGHGDDCRTGVSGPALVEGRRDTQRPGRWNWGTGSKQILELPVKHGGDMGIASE